MNRNLTFPELLSLLTSVFKPRPDEKDLTLFVDLPDAKVPDNTAWMDRRRIAAEWYTMLIREFEQVPFQAVNCCVYPNVGTNNGNLPSIVSLIDRQSKAGRSGSEDLRLEKILEDSSVVIAITELSATAPLKLLARDLGFRGATMPGFTRKMIPALGLDYEQIHSRVMQIKQRLDRARGAVLTLRAGGKAHRLEFDLRGSHGHASGGLIREPGTVANLPSGEAYTVPFEGAGEHNRSFTHGYLPVQFEEEVVVFRVVANRVVSVDGPGPEAKKQAEKLAAEPAYGNIAELGIGVLGEWGVEPVGNTLLDEKLGLHVAFGRSDHFGGKTGPKDFKDPKNVIHIDWVYVPSCQPLIEIESLVLQYEGTTSEQLMHESRLVV